jgi:hypothetical protein
VTTEPVNVNVRLLAGIDRDAARKRLTTTPGVQDVIQTFPQETDEELSSMLLLKVQPSRLQQVVKQLRRDSAIDYVEPAPVRKLIAPIKVAGRLRAR